MRRDGKFAFLWRIDRKSSCVHNHSVFWVLCNRIKHQCLCLRVSGFSLCFHRLHASYQLCVLLNTLKSCRGNGNSRSQSRLAPLHLLCLRNNWRESPETRERRWQSSRPPKHHQDSERAGETSCGLSLENHILKKWGMSHLPILSYSDQFNQPHVCHSWWNSLLTSGRATLYTHLLIRCAPGHRCVTSEM